MKTDAQYELNELKEEISSLEDSVESKALHLENELEAVSYDAKISKEAMHELGHKMESLTSDRSGLDLDNKQVLALKSYAKSNFGVNISHLKTGAEVADYVMNKNVERFSEEFPKASQQEVQTHAAVTLLKNDKLRQSGMFGQEVADKGKDGYFNSVAVRANPNGEKAHLQKEREELMATFKSVEHPDTKGALSQGGAAMHITDLNTRKANLAQEQAKLPGLVEEANKEAIRNQQREDLAPAVEQSLEQQRQQEHDEPSR